MKPLSYAIEIGGSGIDLSHLPYLPRLSYLSYLSRLSYLSAEELADCAEEHKLEARSRTAPPSSFNLTMPARNSIQFLCITQST